MASCVASSGSLGRLRQSRRPGPTRSIERTDLRPAAHVMRTSTSTSLAGWPSTTRRSSRRYTSSARSTRRLPGGVMASTVCQWPRPRATRTGIPASAFHRKPMIRFSVDRFFIPVSSFTELDSKGQRYINPGRRRAINAGLADRPRRRGRYHPGQARRVTVRSGGDRRRAAPTHPREDR